MFAYSYIRNAKRGLPSHCYLKHFFIAYHLPAITLVEFELAELCSAEPTNSWNRKLQIASKAELNCGTW